ncbi:MAG: InlB B-repeat-containing protein [Oscillospiraceae bacterium]|nr:InlB B-repeat-containing protein [Oscillospiraceae bacterium]
MNLLKKGSFALLLGLCLALLPVGAAAETEGEEIQTETLDAEGILQAGGLLLPAERTDGLLGAADRIQQLVDMLLPPIRNWDGVSEEITVDLTSYDYTVDELKQSVSLLLNDHPELFYLSGRYSWSYLGNRAHSVIFTCDTSYSARDIEQFRQTTSLVLRGVEESWTDEQKALYLHDYIVTHCEYDETYSKYNAYNALVEGSAVCQGYTLAYRYLLTEAGVHCEAITSVALNHAWNLVTVDGTRYYVDCTWDDPLRTYQDYCGHGNFLRSQAGITSTGHDSTDWVDESGGNAYNIIDTGTKYETGAYWSDCTTSIPHIGQLWAYASQSGDVYVHDYSGNTDHLLYNAANDVWYVWNEGSKRWASKYVHLATDGKYFYASCPQHILRIGTEGETQAFVTLGDDEKNQGYIYGIRAEGDKLYYRLYTSSSAESFVLENSVPFSGGAAAELSWVFIRADDVRAGFDDKSGKNTYTYPAIIEGEDGSVTLLEPAPGVGLYYWTATKFGYPFQLIPVDKNAAEERFAFTSSGTFEDLDYEDGILSYKGNNWRVDPEAQIWAVPAGGGDAAHYASLSEAVSEHFRNLFQGNIYFVTSGEQGTPAAEVYFLSVPLPNYTVTFDANGGNVSPGSAVVTFRNRYGELPVPVYSFLPDGSDVTVDYDFEGWYTKSEGGTRITENDTVELSANHTLYAHWRDPRQLGWAYIYSAINALGYDTANQVVLYPYNAVLNGEFTSLRLLEPLQEDVPGLYYWHYTKYGCPADLTKVPDGSEPRITAISSDTLRFLNFNGETRSLGYMGRQWRVSPEARVWMIHEDGSAPTRVSLGDAVDSEFQHWLKGSLYLVAASDTDNTVAEVYFLGEGVDEITEPRFATVSANGNTVTAEVMLPAGVEATLIAAAYTEDGRMASRAAAEPLSGSAAPTMKLNTAKAAYIRLFLLDSTTAAPLCAFHEEKLPV